MQLASLVAVAVAVAVLLTSSAANLVAISNIINTPFFATRSLRYACCSHCPPSTFGNVTGLVECAKCDAGKFSDALGNYHCKDCPAKMYSAEGSSVCLNCNALNCLPGHEVLCTDGEDRQCLKCPVGRFSDLGDRCSDCEIGKAAPESGAASCVSCNMGSYSDKLGAATCLFCPTGKYTNDKNAFSSCISCPSGRFSEHSGASSCASCLPGSFSEEGSPICTACLPGEVAATEGSTQCSICASGRYSVDLGSSCAPCPRGQSSTQRSSICTPCEPGTMANIEGSTSCEACSSGKFNPTSGASLCQSCDMGTYTSTPGSSSCSKCARGKYSSSGAISCGSCPAGTYSDRLGSGTCKTCDKPTWSLEDSSSCALCDVGYFSSDGDEACLECPSGANCKVPGLTVSDIKVQRGYWRSSPASHNIIRCPTLEACPGSELLPESDVSQTGSNKTNMNTTSYTCNAGYYGPLCMVCASGYSPSLEGGCKKCPEAQNSVLYLAGYVLATPILLLFVYWLLRKINKGSGSLQEQIKKARNEKGSIMYSLRTKLKILASSWQIVGSLQSVLGLKFPAAFSSFISTISAFVNIEVFTLLPIGCLLSTSYHNRLLVSTLTPLGVYAFVFLIFFLKEVRIGEERSDELRRRVYNTSTSDADKFDTVSNVINSPFFATRFGRRRPSDARVAGRRCCSRSTLQYSCAWSFPTRSSRVFLLRYSWPFVVNVTGTILPCGWLR